jgi:hypothetical protein
VQPPVLPAAGQRALVLQDCTRRLGQASETACQLWVQRTQQPALRQQQQQARLVWLLLVLETQ